jgi:hypothetical protein
LIAYLLTDFMKSYLETKQDVIHGSIN